MYVLASLLSTLNQKIKFTQKDGNSNVNYRNEFIIRFFFFCIKHIFIGYEYIFFTILWYIMV